MNDKDSRVESVVEYRVEYPKFKELPLFTRIISVLMISIAVLFLFGYIGLIVYFVYALI